MRWPDELHKQPFTPEASHVLVPRPCVGDGTREAYCLRERVGKHMGHHNLLRSVPIASEVFGCIYRCSFLVVVACNSHINSGRGN